MRLSMNMKKIFIFLAVVLICGCDNQARNPDEMFDDFYQGTPSGDTFSIEENKINNTDANKKESFTISGDSDNYSCTIVCEEK